MTRKQNENNCKINIMVLKNHLQCKHHGSNSKTQHHCCLKGMTIKIMPNQLSNTKNYEEIRISQKAYIYIEREREGERERDTYKRARRTIDYQ